MAQLLTERGTSTSPTGVITVADLLTRYAADPMVEPATMPVSVGILLRREGRAAHAADRPIQARAARQADGYEDEYDTIAPARRGLALRRSAIAAGVLLAAGTVFGATVVDTGSSPAGDDLQPVGGYPGQGRLDTQPVPDGAIPTIVDNTAQSDPLDSGVAAPTSWMATAFPGSGTGPTNGTPSNGGPSERAAAPSTGSGNSSGTADPATGGGSPADDQRADAPGGRSEDTADGTDGSGDTGSGDTGGGDTGSGDTGGGDTGGSRPPADEDRGSGGLGSTVSDLGANAGPLEAPVTGVGETVSSLGSGLSTATSGSPGPVGTVGSLAGGLLS